MKKLILALLALSTFGLGFVACDLDDDDDCPSSKYHLYYTSNGRSYEYSSESACKSRASEDGYACYSYSGGICYGYK